MLAGALTWIVTFALAMFPYASRLDGVGRVVVLGCEHWNPDRSAYLPSLDWGEVFIPYNFTKYAWLHVNSTTARSQTFRWYTEGRPTGLGLVLSYQNIAGFAVLSENETLPVQRNQWVYLNWTLVVTRQANVGPFNFTIWLIVEAD